MERGRAHQVPSRNTFDILPSYENIESNYNTNPIP
jgi:hypothetical protein